MCALRFVEVATKSLYLWLSLNRDLCDASHIVGVLSAGVLHKLSMFETVRLMKREHCCFVVDYAERFLHFGLAVCKGTRRTLWNWPCLSVLWAVWDSLCVVCSLISECRGHCLGRKGFLTYNVRKTGYNCQ